MTNKLYDTAERGNAIEIMHSNPTHNKKQTKESDHTPLLHCPNIRTSTLAAMKRQVMPMSCSVDLKTFLCVAMKRSK